MSDPTPEQMNCGQALYGPPALCTCGTCPKALDGFDGPSFDTEPKLCAGCWDNSGQDIKADNDIPAGEPIYWRLVNVEYDEWDGYCGKCAAARAAETYDDNGDLVSAPAAP